MVLLTAAMMGLTASLGIASQAVNGAIGAIKILSGVPGKIVGATNALTKAFSGLDISLKNLSKTFQASIVAADQLQKRNLALGRDFAGFGKTFKGQIDKLPGVLSERLGTSMTMVENGLRGNTLRTAQLTQTMRMTGGNWKGMIKKLEATQTELGLNNNALERLSVATMKARDTYGVAAENLVAAVGALTTVTKRNAALIDKGGPLAEAMAAMSGRLGGRGAGQLGSISELLFGGGATFGEAGMLGLGGARRMAQRGGSGDIERALQMVIAAAPRVRQFMNQLGGDAGIAGDALHSVYEHGLAIVQLANLQKIEQTSLIKAMTKNRNVTNQLSEIGKKMWEPIQEMWLNAGTGLFQKLLDNAQLIQKAFTTFVVDPLTLIIKKFTELFLNNEDFYDGLRSIFVGVATILGGVATFLQSNFGQDGGDSVYARIVKGFGGMIKKVGGMWEEFTLGFLPKMQLGFFSMIEAILKALNKIDSDFVDKSTFKMIAEASKDAKLNVMVKKYEENIAEGKDEGTAIRRAMGGLWNKGMVQDDWMGWTRGLATGTYWKGRLHSLGIGISAGAKTRIEDTFTGKKWTTKTSNPYEVAGQRARQVGGMAPPLLGDWAEKQAIAAQLNSAWFKKQKSAWSGEVKAIQESIIKTRKEAILGRKGERGATFGEEVDKLMGTMLLDNKQKTKEQKDYIKAFDIMIEELGGIKNNTKKDDDDIPIALDTFGSTQADALSNAITTILLDAKQEHLLRVQQDVLEQLFGIKTQTTLQRMLAEDAAPLAQGEK